MSPWPLTRSKLNKFSFCYSSRIGHGDGCKCICSLFNYFYLNTTLILVLIKPKWKSDANSHVMWVPWLAEVQWLMGIVVLCRIWSNHGTTLNEFIVILTLNQMTQIFYFVKSITLISKNIINSIMLARWLTKHTFSWWCQWLFPLCRLNAPSSKMM